MPPQPAPAHRPHPGRTLVPIGGGYLDAFAGFARAAVANARGGVVAVLVLPMTFSSSAESITPRERAANLRQAEERCRQIEEACRRVAPPGVRCRAATAPICTRADALAPEALSCFADDLAAIFILGGDQTVAMRVIAGTPVEAALAEAYARGVVIGGTSAGASMQSAAMMGGGLSGGSSLDFGRVEIWNAAGRRGLSFGLRGAITDQHFFQRGRVGRLLSAISLPGAPRVGIGVDAFTGAVVRDGARLGEVFGLYTVAVLDAGTYHAAERARHLGADHTLSLRNVLAHLLAPGGSSYDLAARAHALAPPPARLARDYAPLAAPGGAGPLILAGDLGRAPAGHPALDHLRALARPGGRALVVAAGFLSAPSGEAAAGRFAAALGLPADTVVLDPGGPPLTVPRGVSALLVVGHDQSLIRPEQLGALREAWLAGAPLLLDDAAAALAGPRYSAHGPTPRRGEAAEAATQGSLLQGGTRLCGGLGLIAAGVEPQLLDDNRWGRLYSLAFNGPARFAVGLSRGGALEIGPAGARALGDAPLLALDLRTAARELGANGAFVVANGLIDVFAPGEAVAPAVAEAASYSGATAVAPARPAAAARRPAPPPARGAARLVSFGVAAAMAASALLISVARSVWGER